MRFSLCLGLMVGLIAPLAQAQTAHFVKVAAFPGDGEGDVAPSSTFTSNIAEITVGAQIQDVGAGDKVMAAWIAEKVDGAPPDYQIDSSTVTVDKPSVVGFHLSKPTAGWPKGAYRVDLSYNGHLELSEHFSVQ